MKKLLYILSAALLFAAVSCQDQVEPYQPGEPDVEGCFNVFFPDQEAATIHYFEPAAEKKVEVTVKRKIAEGAIDVPYAVVADNPDVYSVGQIHFDDAQEETTVVVELKSSAEEATEYPITIEIQDPKYASKYGADNAFFTMSSMIVVWQTLGTFTFDDRFAEQTVVAEIVYYDIDGVRTCKTQNERDIVIYGEDGGYGPTDGGFFNLGADRHLEFKWYTKNQNPKGYDYVEVPPIYMFESGVGPAYICDYLNYYHMNGSLLSYDYQAYINADNPQGFTLPYYDERGELYLYLATPIEGTSYWYGAQEIIGLKEGYVPTDYSLAISTDVSKDGKVPVYVETGTDVTQIYYNIYEGALGKAVAGDHISAIAKKTEEAQVAEITSTSTVLEVALEKSGEYTIIVVPVNAKEEPQEDNAAYAVFNFLAEGETNPVEAEVGLETLSGKYVPKGYNSDSSLEFWAYGTDIVSAKLGLYKYTEIAGADMNEVNAAVKEGKSLGEEAIEAINGEGYSTIISNLLPGTRYVAVVYVSNGYEEDWLYGIAETTGDPLPVYQQFTVNDYYGDGDFANAEATYGDWNYYGLDAYGTLGLREYLGKVNISASTTPTEGPDANGFYDEYVNVTGLFGDLSWLAGYGMPTAATLEMDVYAGIIYHFQKTVVEGNYNVYVGAKGDEKWYTASYYSAFIPVMEGYYAFVHVSSNNTDYNFSGLGLVDPDAGWIAKIWDPLLVAPDKDDNGLAPSRADVARAKKIFRESVSEITFTGDAKTDMRKAINRYNDKMSAYKPVDFTSVQIPFAGKLVNADVTVSTGSAPRASWKTMGPVRNDK